MTTKRKAGRPMDRTRDGHILRSTLALLVEVGFDNLRMEDVAEHASVGLSTIYRRWPTRDQLIIAAVRAGFEPGESVNVASDDSPRDQLHDLARALNDDGARLIQGLVLAIQRDPQLADAFRESWLNPRLEALRGALQKTGRGARARQGLLADIGPALVTFRLLMTHEPIDAKFIDRIVDEIIEPLS